MLPKFIKNWFVAKEGISDHDRYDIYKPAERMIFSYFNGKEMIKADPLVVYRTLMTVGKELDIDIKIATSPLKNAPEAHANIVKKVRSIFDLKSFTEGGLTEVECLDLLDRFLLYTNQVKKNSSPLPTYSTPSEVSPAATSEQANPATTNTSAYGSTAEESSTAAPASSPSVQESPGAASTPM